MEQDTDPDDASDDGSDSGPADRPDVVPSSATGGGASDGQSNGTDTPPERGPDTAMSRRPCATEDKSSDDTQCVPAERVASGARVVIWYHTAYG